MSTAWSSPGARAVEPSPEQHASRRQPIDMSSIPRTERYRMEHETAMIAADTYQKENAVLQMEHG